MTTTSQRFEGILDRYFEDWLSEEPTAAVAAGLRSGEGQLGAATEAHLQRRQRARSRAGRDLAKVNPRELTPEQHLDRLAFRALIARENEDHDRGRPGLEPHAPDVVLNAFLRELQRGEDEPNRAARNLRSLLRATPRFLEEAATVVRQPEPLWLRVMQQTVAGSKGLLGAVGTFLSRQGTDPADTRNLASTGRALERYREQAESKPAAPDGSFAIGADRLQRRIRDELGLDNSIGEVESLARAEASRIGGELSAACRRFGPGKSAEAIIGEARAKWRPGEDLLGIYERETRRVAEAFRSAKVVSFPTGDELVVRSVPEFMRHLFPTAAYSNPGAFEKRQRGVFWVNDLGVGLSSPAARLSERQQHFGLSLTCAHEAYPGHHLQFVTANQHPRRWRRLFAHAVFYEGWTLWCEQMMVDLKVDRTPWLRVQQLHDALWRCHRILIDIRLQTGRYSATAAVRHLQRHLGFTRARAEAEVNWYSAAPAVPMSYWLGRLENDRLYRRLVTGRRWSRQRFNDWLLASGTLPQSWLEKYALD